jgi:hypothetical protein
MLLLHQMCMPLVYYYGRYGKATLLIVKQQISLPSMIPYTYTYIHNREKEPPFDGLTPPEIRTRVIAGTRPPCNVIIFSSSNCMNVCLMYAMYIGCESNSYKGNTNIITIINQSMLGTSSNKSTINDTSDCIIKFNCLIIKIPSNYNIFHVLQHLLSVVSLRLVVI